MANPPAGRGGGPVNSVSGGSLGGIGGGTGGYSGGRRGSSGGAGSAAKLLGMPAATVTRNLDAIATGELTFEQQEFAKRLKAALLEAGNSLL